MKPDDGSIYLSNFASAMHPTIQFHGGNGKTITLWLDTGRVEHEGYTPDEAAQVFWECVTKCHDQLRPILAGLLREPPRTGT